MKVAQINSSLSSSPPSSSSIGKTGFSLEKFRASIINLSQGYSQLEDRIVKSRQNLYNNKTIAAVTVNSQFLCANMRYQEDALCIKHSCENYSRCKVHDICMTFHQIAKEYRQLEEKASQILDIFETITDKSQICVVAILINKLYEQKLELETYFS